MSASGATQILYKGKILGTCSVILFITPVPNIIGYEMLDTLDVFPADTWLSNFKPVEDEGKFDISRYKTVSGYSTSNLVSDLLKLLTDRYASISYQIYSSEITHGTH